MQTVRVFRLVPLLFAALLLAGCIVSESPLFDAEHGITPIAAGRYDELMRGDDGGFEQVDTVTLAVEGNVYTLNGDDGRNPVHFTMHDAGKGLIVAMTVEDGEAGYALLRAEDGEILHWAAVCEVASKLGIVEDHPGVEDDGLNCTIRDRETLVSLMRDYASHAQPDYRYRRAGG